MKYDKDTAYMCQEGTDIVKLPESRLTFKIFVAKYSKPFFSETVSENFFKLCSLKDQYVSYKEHEAVLKV